MKAVMRDKIESAAGLFGIPEGVTYLNCANMSPQLRAVTQIGVEAVRRKAAPWNLTTAEWFSGAEELREACAQLLGVERDGIAIVPAASYGIAVAAANLEVKAGQSIVLLDQEFPSNVYAWRELAKRQKAVIQTVRRMEGENWTAALLRSIDANTAIVTLPHCHWTDGSAVDLVRVSKRARAVGAALVIDASQSMGACPLDMAAIQPDFLVSVGYKWLLGPYGLGYLYVAPKWRERGIPIEQSWLTRAGSEDFARLVDYVDEYRPGARRFDMGEFPQFVLAPMATAALQQILAWGVDTIHETLSRLTDHIEERARESGYSVLPRGDRLGHMIGIRPAQGIASGLTERLRKEQIYVSVRGDSIRIAPHVYNNVGDVERLFAVLGQRAS